MNRRDVLPATLSAFHHDDDGVGPDGYIVIARRTPSDLKPYEGDDPPPEWWSSAEWAWDHLERFHGWTAEEIAYERDVEPDGIGGRHNLEHHPNDEPLDPTTPERARRPEDLPIPHVHDQGPEVAIAYDNAMTADLREALLALLEAAGGARWA